MSYFEHMASFIGGNGFRSARLPVLELSVETSMAVMSGTLEPMKESEAAFVREMLARNSPCIIKTNIPDLLSVAFVFNVGSDANGSPHLVYHSHDYTYFVAENENGMVMFMVR